MQRELTFFEIRKLSVNYRANVMQKRAKTLFVEFGTGDLKDIVSRLSRPEQLNHDELDKIDSYLMQLKDIGPPPQQPSDPQKLEELKRLGGD